MYDCIDFSKEAYYVLQTSPFIYKHIKVTLSVSSRDKEVDLKDNVIMNLRELKGIIVNVDGGKEKFNKVTKKQRYICI